MPCEAFQPPSGGPRGSDRQMQQCHPRTDLESRASTLGCKRVAVGIPWQGGSRMRAAVDPGLAPRRRGCNGADHRGAIRRAEQERLAELEAKNTFQNRTLRAIRVVAEKVPPNEARRALRAIDALAKEALAEAKPERS